MNIQVASNPTASPDGLINITMTQGEWNELLQAIHFSRCANGCDPDKEYGALINFKEEVQKHVWA